MPNTIRILTVLICTLPLLLHAEEAQLENQTTEAASAKAAVAAATTTAATPAATATTAALLPAQTSTVGRNKAARQKPSKEELLQEALWQAQRAQRFEQGTAVSQVNTTCNYSRSTLTYSCE